MTRCVHGVDFRVFLEYLDKMSLTWFHNAHSVVLTLTIIPESAPESPEVAVCEKILTREKTKDLGFYSEGTQRTRKELLEQAQCEALDLAVYLQKLIESEP